MLSRIATIVFLAPIISFIYCSIHGIVLIKLWSYFLTPTYGWAAPSIPVAIGISLIIGFLTHQSVHTEDKRTNSERYTESLINGFVSPLMVWFMGWIVSQWM